MRDVKPLVNKHANCTPCFSPSGSPGSVCLHPQFREAGGVCRRSADECDLPEYCTGASQHCPEDSFEMNGKLCYNHEQGYCYDGQCPTHKQHCWRLFGSGTPGTPPPPIKALNKHNGHC